MSERIKEPHNVSILGVTAFYHFEFYFCTNYTDYSKKLFQVIQYNAGKVTFVLNGENPLDFRQKKYGRIYDGTINNPLFHKLWAPIDGRVINLSIKWKL